jgi:hypothetical protein
MGTSRPDVLHPKPRVLFTLMGGWLYLFLRLAFVRRRFTCTACGENFRRRTAASYLALVTLFLFVFLILVGLFLGDPGE